MTRLFNPCMVFIPDQSVLGNIRTSYPSAHGFMTTALLGSEIEQIEGDFGSYATEYLDEGIGEFLQHRWVIRNQVLLHPYSIKSNITIHYMLRGNINCLLHGAGSVRLQEGTAQMFYLPAGIQQDAFFEAGEYYSFQVVFSNELLDEFMKESPQLREAMEMMTRNMQEGKMLAPTSVSKNIQEIFRRVKTCTFDKLRRRKFMESQLYELLAIYLEEIELDGKKDSGLDHLARKKIQPILHYIEENLDQLHTVGPLSKMTGLTQGTFRRYFQKHTGKSFRDYMKQLRLDSARRMLLESNMTVKEIAVDCGFCNSSELNHQFKGAFGLTPLEYRRNGGDERLKCG